MTYSALRFLLLLALFLFLFPTSPQAGMERDAGLILRGVAKTVGSALHVPSQVLAGTAQSFPLGVVGGAVGGTMKAVGGTLSGAWDIARGSAPYAKYLVFL
ncbi:MAG: hypothetical protein FGM27_04105 [Candidatus Omnitrophica bacterium]|nr:hypothetical protein [Candidatus Omnitrophota bacterium]